MMNSAFLDELVLLPQVPSESQDEMDTEVDQVDGEDDDDCYLNHSGHCRQMSGQHSLLSCERPPSVCSRTSACSCGSSGSLKRQASAKRKTITVQVNNFFSPEDHKIYFDVKS